jgi:hypothetical protein
MAPAQLQYRHARAVSSSSRSSVLHTKPLAFAQLPWSLAGCLWLKSVVGDVAQLRDGECVAPSLQYSLAGACWHASLQPCAEGCSCARGCMTECGVEAGAGERRSAPSSTCTDSLASSQSWRTDSCHRERTRAGVQGSLSVRLCVCAWVVSFHLVAELVFVMVVQLQPRRFCKCRASRSHCPAHLGVPQVDVTVAGGGHHRRHHR